MSSSAITGPILSDVRRSPSGSAAAPSWSFADATGTGVYLASTDVLALSTAGVQRVVVDASGNVGIGTTPSAWAGTYKAVQLSSGKSALFEAQGLTFLSNNYFNNGTNDVYFSNGQASRYYQFNGTHTWAYAASGTAGNTVSWNTGMTLDASGNLLVGTTSALGRLTIQGTGGTNYSAAISQDNSGGNVLGVFGPTNGTSQNFVVFAQAGNVKGTISTNGSTTSYNPSSDRRLKDNIQPLQNGLSSVMKLKPVTYNWKVTGDTDDGFIAQDLQGIPEFAHRVNPIGKAEDGSDLYGVDYMKFTAVLAAAIQEQQAMIEALKAEVAALKAP